ncbi:MAG: beta-ketoacyl synthase N-terminal-like domain-containing protein [Evtepia gabavorous]
MLEQLEVRRPRHRPHHSFDTTDYKTKIAAEGEGLWTPGPIWTKPRYWRSDAFSQYGCGGGLPQAVEEESGVIGTPASERVAVYFGSGIGGIRTPAEEHNKLLARGPKRVSPYFIPMLIANMAAGMIAIRFNCRGAAMPSVTACASGTNAIGEAMPGRYPPRLCRRGDHRRRF